MDQEHGKPEQPVKFEWLRRKDGTPDIYSNYVNASWTLFDVRVTFGQLLPLDVGSNSGFVVEERAAVTIAWAEAKILRDALNDLVARYEKVNGEIKPINLAPNTPLT
jgi:hypothetical protein